MQDSSETSRATNMARTDEGGIGLLRHSARINGAAIVRPYVGSACQRVTLAGEGKAMPAFFKPSMKCA